MPVLRKGELLKLKIEVVNVLMWKWACLFYEDLSEHAFKGTYQSPDKTLMFDVELNKKARGRHRGQVSRVILKWSYKGDTAPGKRLTKDDILPLINGFRNNNYR